MATVQNNNYGTNRIGGTGVGSHAGQGLFAESSTAKYDLGAKLEFSDGRVFRYTKAGAAITAGHLVAQDFSAGNIAEFDDATISPVAAGSTVITITASALSGVDDANELAGSYLMTIDGTGEYYSYKIKSHTVESSNAVEFTLFDPLHTAVVSGETDLQIIAPAFRQVITCAASTDANSDTMPVGVSFRGLTSGYYGWIQTSGIACVRYDRNSLTATDIHAGRPVVPSVNHGGSVQPSQAAAEGTANDLTYQVGTLAYGDVVDNQQAAVYLNLPA
tara:strand:- start:82 stop:906 length:825 start_codon:yes stop_codon:yes gene_type:complete